MKVNFKNFKNYVKIFGLIVFIYILYRIDLGTVFNSMKNAHWPYLTAAFFLLIGFHLLKAIRWQFLLRGKSIDLPLRQCYLIYVIGLYWGLITPGRMGDLIKAYYIKKEGHPFSDGIIVSLMDRILDIFIFLGFSILGFLQLYAIHIKSFKISMIHVLGFCLVIFLCFVLYHKKDFFLNKFFHLKFIKKLREEVTSFKQYFLKMAHWKNSLFLIVFSIFAWFVYLMVIFILLVAFHVKITFFQTMICFFVSTLISFIPVSYAGLGTRDATLVFLFQSYGYPSENGILFSFSILLVYICTIAFGLLATIFTRIPDSVRDQKP